LPAHADEAAAHTAESQQDNNLVIRKVYASDAIADRLSAIRANLRPDRIAVRGLTAISKREQPKLLPSDWVDCATRNPVD